MNGTQIDDIDWAERCEFWQSGEPRPPGRPKKYRYREPIIIGGYGANLRVDSDTLLVRDGFTRHPQKLKQYRFFPGDENLPDRIIILDGSGGISFDALAWMSEQNISLVRMDFRGKVSFVGAAATYAADPKIVKMQRAAKAPGKQLEQAKNIIQEKISASMTTLSETFPISEQRDRSTARLREFRDRLRSSKEIRTMQDVFGIEGGAASAYFQAWHGQKLGWKGLGRTPIPESWLELGPRSMTWRKGAQNARHPVNAMLNYGYAILVSQVRTQLTAAGYDLGIGIMHSSSENSIPLVYDLMEPLRPVVDRHVLKFALSHTFTPRDFTINRVGGCRLNPELARALVGSLSKVPLAAQLP